MQCYLPRRLMAGLRIDVGFWCGSLRHTASRPFRGTCFRLLLLSAVLLLSNKLGLCADATPGTAARSRHWAFQPVVRHTAPDHAVRRVSKLENEIDAFIAASLESQGQHISEPADRATLLRRVTFDLVGLPPTPEDVAAFLADDSPDAFERVVDRLLSHPHYGETWGRNWLDVVRFAETAGFREDPLRPYAYTYRDYVIRSYNRDLPFDRFVMDQLAGDELFPDDTESLAATGYCRMWPDESNASDILLARQTALDDLTGNVGAVFLGLSIGCAQCHDHKFDPLLQTDFYQLQAFFSGIVLEDQVPLGTRDQLAAYRQEESAWLAETAELRRELALLEQPARVKLQGERRMKFPAEVLEALDTPLEDRTTMQRQLAFWSARQMGVKEEDIPKHLDEAARERREQVLASLATARQRQPRPPRESNLMAVAELTSIPPATFRMESGSYDQPREQLEPHFPVVLRTEKTAAAPSIAPPTNRTSGRRSELARWLVSADHPLTHRVWVNRLWQGHFGQGLIANANDFGTQTPAPVHQDLLDWLASESIRQGFHSKPLHRRIVSSATYRQASSLKSDSDSLSGIEESHEVASPYSAFPRHRLSSERIRDAWLVASGQLNDSMYGPGTRPELPPNFTSLEWKVSEPAQQVRRSVYLFAKRNLPYPMMAAFDFPDMHEACGCRTKTTIAPQALMLLNDRIILNAARQLASRARLEATSADPAATVERAWQIAFSRTPTESEVRSALKFIADQYQLVTDGAEPTTGETLGRNTEHEALVDFCHALLNANEFLFVD
ncbi:DUF1549 and DUF1553 domain-containing protein [Schlesneria sp. DSM 10557]|uniref:DUF1549 and DUF1553 domain-containing protein n=1 Tax=Schlesneria sp. DSM 10557 TaxID=3044399 RepID=UPI00359F5AAA